MTTFYSADQSPSLHALRAVEVASGGEVAAHRDPAYVTATNPAAERNVALVSGGGAGHEPMHALFVGRGGLDAAVPGEVFTSPHSRQIHDACAAVARDGGVLQLVKNYTGDRINFAIAAETLTADGVRVEEVVIDDDLGSDVPADASSDTDEAGPGRRGTAATVIVEKILGAAADRGLSIEQLRDYGAAIVASSRSLAVARGAHTAPESSDPAFDVEGGTLEYGVGIHGETAREQIEQPTLADLIDRMVGEILEAIPATDNGVIALVNGLGGVAPLELAHISVEVERALADRGVSIRSLTTGTFITALDMAGFSLTLTAVEDEDWLQDWFAPHGTVGLPAPRAYVEPAGEAEGACDCGCGCDCGDQCTCADDWDCDCACEQCGGEFEQEASAWLDSFISDLESLKDPLNALDQKAGDGDVGSNLAGAVRAARRHSTGPEASFAEDLRSIASGFLSDTGGSSGPLFGLVLQEIANAARDAEPLLDGVRAGQEAVTRVGGAKPGDRTMIDALDAAVNGSSDLDADAVDAAIDGAKSTKDMVGAKGRSSYLGDRVLGVPDPGALAMACVLLLIAEGESGTKLRPQRTRLRRVIGA